jgi:hypothetical protein
MAYPISNCGSIQIRGGINDFEPSGTARLDPCNGSDETAALFELANARMRLLWATDLEHKV